MLTLHQKYLMSITGQIGGLEGFDHIDIQKEKTLFQGKVLIVLKVFRFSYFFIKIS